MALTQEQLDVLKNKYKVRPTKDLIFGDGSESYADFRKKYEARQRRGLTPQVQAEEPGYLERVKTEFTGGLKKAVEAPLRGAEEVEKGDVLGGLALGATGAGAGAARAIFSPVTAAILPLITKGVEGASELSKAINNWGKNNPDAAKTLTTLLSPTAKTGRDLFGATKKLAQGHPLAAENLMNTIEIFTAGKTPKIAGGGLAKTGERLISGAEKTFAKQAEDIAVKGLEELTQKQRQGVAGRVSERVFGGRTIIPDNREMASINEITKMISEGKIKGNASVIEHRKAIDAEITREAIELENKLKNMPSGQITEEAVEAYIKGIKDEIEKDFPVLITGDAKEALDNLFPVLTQEIKGLKNLEAVDVLRVRKGIDTIIKDQKGAGVFNPDKATALSIATKELRQGLNDLAASLSPTVEVKRSLAKQSALFDALSAVDNRFAKQSTNAFYRIVQKLPLVGALPKSEIIEAMTAIGLVGGAALFSGPIAVILTAGWLTKKGVGRVLSAKNRKALGEILTKFKPENEGQTFFKGMLEKLRDGASLEDIKKDQRGSTPASSLLPEGLGKQAEKLGFKQGEIPGQLIEAARNFNSAEELIKKTFYEVENISSNQKLAGKNQIWFITSDGTPISVRKRGGGISGGHDGTIQDLNLSSIEIAKGGLARARVSVIPEKSIVIETKTGLNEKQIKTIEKFYPEYKVYYERTKIDEPFNGTSVKSQIIDKGKNIKSQLTDIWNEENKTKVGNGKSLADISDGDLKGLEVEYLGDNYRVLRQTGVSGDLIIIGRDGKQLRIPKSQAKIADLTKEPLLDTLNPTGSLYVDYTPKDRATIKLAPNITTLDKTMDKPADTMITIYRGAPKIQKSIVPGDFITTNYDLAKSYTGENNVLSKRVKLSDVLDDLEDPLGEEYLYRPSNKPLLPAYKETGSLSTKILSKLEGRATVSKQFISDLTNSPDLKQTERDLIREALKTEGDKIDVAKFAEKVKLELLPLERVSSNSSITKKIDGGGSVTASTFAGRYENINLPTELRGNIKDYSENIYESPIKTSAGGVHFAGATKEGSFFKYFGHTRIEDMADNKTRRVIEVQSDLYQKGRLESSVIGENVKPDSEFMKNFNLDKSKFTPELKLKQQKQIEAFEERQKNISKLQQYNDPTAHFRMIREEVKKASQDGKSKLQFPTGETAMKVEGLGERNPWTRLDAFDFSPDANTPKLKVEDLKVGLEINNGMSAEQWVVTEVLGDGKFKAVPKNGYVDITSGNSDRLSHFSREQMLDNISEQFDISGKVDTNNPIYKFYDKEVRKYLTSKYQAKEITDDKGVNWMQVDLKPEYGKLPVEAFGIVGLTVGAGALEGQ